MHLLDEAWVETTFGTDTRGLSLTEASQVGLLAFIASQVASKRLVVELARHFKEGSVTLHFV